MMSSWESQLSTQEVKYFTQLFQSISKTQEGIVTGSEAVHFFASSGVPNQILSEIWEAADRDKVGYLTPETFSIALKLIACAQHGKEAASNVLSTVVPLPQFDGSNVVAPSPLVSNTPLSSSASLASAPITSAEREKYANIFKVHQPVNGVLDANTAKNVFLKSKLSMDTLSQIWYLADVRQSGSLNQTEFIIAMHYIAKLMDGTLTSLPDKLPPTVFQSANNGNTTQQSPLMRNMTIGSPSFHNARQQSMMTPPQRARTIDSLGNLAFGPSAPIHDPVQQWDVSAQEKQQFDVYFDKIDSSKAGVIQGKEAVEFFKNSRLPETDLAHIWDLADIQQRGALSRNEFAVAMHLIHKKLAGEALPQTLPKSLIPPSNTVPQQSPFGNSPAFGSSPAFTPKNLAVSPAPHQSRSLIDANNNNDLLGDFDNDQVSNETNQVNLMQNQISSLSLQTSDIKNQKASTENVLEQLANQKKELEAQLTNVRMTHETAVKDLNGLQATVRREEGEWDQVRTSYDAAQQQLTTLQNEIAQANQTLENGRAETESLRRRVNEIQEETRLANAELEKLRAQTKQNTMMLDINRRQVTAAEQDRAQARRHLEDYKVAGGLNTQNNDDSETDSEENDTSIFADSKEITSTKDTPTSPEGVPSAVSTPALYNLFGGSPSPKPASPFASTDFGTSHSPFAAFSPSSASAAPTATTTGAEVDFDSIFGNVGSTPSATSVPVNAFEPVQWAAPSTPSVKTGRGPPPPPPQSRHHRQPSESVSSVNSVTSPSTISSSKKPRAPPPPPPAASTSTDPLPSTSKVPEEDEDDFEAAFSGKQLPEAKVITKDDDFDDFDDAFSTFDTKAAAAPITSSPVPVDADASPVAANNDNWASSFGGFNFPGTEDTATAATPIADTTTTTTTTTTKPVADDDWDSIFGTSTVPSNPTTVSKETAPVDQGFDDAFSSFGDDFGKQPVVPTSKVNEKKPVDSTPVTTSPPTSTSIGIVGDKIEELVKIGFAEQEAKDALNRYDQDLEKATNFLLDQSSKQQA